MTGVCLCRVVSLWKEDLAKTNVKAAQSLADPMQYENLFPELKQALEAEEALKEERENLQPAANFPHIPVCAVAVSCACCSSVWAHSFIAVPVLL